MRSSILLLVSTILTAIPVMAANPNAGKDPVVVKVRWNDVTRVSETVPTTQHLANALTLHSNPLNKKLLMDLRDLHTNDTRLQLWFSVPNQVVAEMKEPTVTETFWNFKYMDPVVIDYFANTTGRHHLNIGTIPRWMFNVSPTNIPGDPAASFYPYTQGTTGALLKDPTGKQFADYQVRIYQWYTQGGFTDEIGKYHKSGYHFKIDYWGILNEPDFENKLNVEQYTKIWDAVAEAIHKIDSNVQFMGPEVSGAEVAWAGYFLNPKNHDSSAPPVQWFSFHNYASGNNDPATWPVKFFTNENGASVKGFRKTIQKVIDIRDALSPHTKLAIDELGTFDVLVPGDNVAMATEQYADYAPLYWVASGAYWAGNFITAENLGIPLISMTQMVGAPTQSESCSMINWDTAEPNAHYQVLSLIKNNFGPGDKLVTTESSSSDVTAQASITPSGRKILLVNTSNRSVSVNLSDAFPGVSLRVVAVDETFGGKSPRPENVAGKSVTLAPFAVAVVSNNLK